MKPRGYADKVPSASLSPPRSGRSRRLDALRHRNNLNVIDACGSQILAIAAAESRDSSKSQTDQALH